MDTCNQNDSLFLWGMLQINNSSARTYNYYNQNKWSGIKKLDSALIKMGKYMYNDNHLIYDNTRTIDKESLPFKYIYDLKSIYRSPELPFDFISSNIDAIKYWEQGFFKPDLNLNALEKSKYLLTLNKRCTPEDSLANGDLRNLKIKFVSSELPEFVNWKVIDIKTNKVIRTFDKDSNIYVDMGEFQPGEGKLYKIAPVMQEGGTLVANEYIEGVSFVCKDTVKNNGKNIEIHDGTDIQFKTDAAIIMSGGNFICSNENPNNHDNVYLHGYSGQLWNGISLNNTGSSTRIEKTKLEDSKTPVIIRNDESLTSYNLKVIRRNYFKIDEDYGKAVSIFNQHSITIDSNTFYVPDYNSTIAIYYSNHINDPEAAAEPPETDYRINIINNIFDGAYIPVHINDLAANYTTFFMFNNTFQNTGLFGITGRKITGSIKKNRFLNASENYSIYLSESNPDIYGNVFVSEKRNMVLCNSYPNLSPFRTGSNQLIWEGGRNAFIITSTADTSENLRLKTSLPQTHLGENNFNLGNSYSYHIYGTVPVDNERIYRTIMNCWTGNNDLPRIFIYNPSDTPITPIGYIFEPTSCELSENISVNITEVGFGTYDTTLISEYDSNDVMTEDEALYTEGREYLENQEYTNAITSFKSLIDNYNESEKIYDALAELYVSYHELDTSKDEETIDLLYINLKQYLEAKINSENYDEDFEDNAYGYILMCETRMEEYNEALTGYEFISLYNPDIQRRIEASWEYQNIEELFNGMGGGGKSNYELRITNYESGNEEKELLTLEIQKRKKILDELADKDPIKRHLKEQYQSSANNNNNNNTNGIRNNVTKDGVRVRAINLNEDKLNERAKQNIYSSKNLSKDEKEKRRFEDMKLLLNPDNAETGKKETDNLIPAEYSLSQNYPNPFNPITKINFALPKEGNVKLIVYDILGREIIKLVNNEFKMAGKYTVEFNGISVASGVYFYRLESDNFVQTKRMVLLK